MAAGFVLYDCIYLIVAAALWGGSAWVGVEVAARLSRALGLWAAPLGAPAGLLALVAAVWALGLLLPRVKPGRYDMMKGPVFWGWLLRSLLRRVLYWPPLKYLMFSSNVLRFLSLRALGARVAFTASMSTDVELLDPWLLRVGPRAMLGTRTLVAGHYVKGGQLVLAEVSIGAGCLCAAEVLVGPGVTVGDRAQVLSRAALGPGAQVGADATVGGAAILEPGAEVAAGGTVETGARVGPA